MFLLHITDTDKNFKDMKKQINDLLLKMQTGENCIGETANALLILCEVIPRYSVSLVYVKNITNGQKTALRCFITNADSEEEALGKAVIYFTDEMKNFNLSNKVVLRVNEG